MTVQQLIVPALQASIMLTVLGFGLPATIDDISYLFRRPALLARSFLSMFVLMPAVAVILATAFGLHPSVAIVLVALAISPVPPLLPGKEGKAAGHVGYALSLMVIVSFSAIVVIPVAMAVLGGFVERPFASSGGAVAKIALMTILLPLGIGIAIRAFMPGLADRLTKPVRLIATGLLLVTLLPVLIAVVPKTGPLIGGGTLLAMTAFVVVGLAVGHWLGGPRRDEATILALSTATRHPAIALAVSKANFPDEPLLVPAVVLYLLVAAVVSVPYILRQRRLTAASAS